MLPLFYSQTSFETSVETTDVGKSKVEYTGFIARLHVTNIASKSLIVLDGSLAKSTKKEGDILVDKGGKRQNHRVR